MEIDRRLFLISAASALPLYAGPPVFFTPAETKLIDAICDRIVPPDDAPGASQAGVVFYIDKQLLGPLKRFQQNYRLAIPKFETACRERTGKDFPALPPAEQTAFLQRIDSKEHPDLAPFFSLLVDHTMQGFYGSPEHGGNRDEASWKMLGIAAVMEGHQH